MKPFKLVGVHNGTASVRYKRDRKFYVLQEEGEDYVLYRASGDWEPCVPVDPTKFNWEELPKPDSNRHGDSFTTRGAAAFLTAKVQAGEPSEVR